MMMLENSRGPAAFRVGLIASMALAVTGCANEPANHSASFAPMMMLSSAALVPAAPVTDLANGADGTTPIRSVTHQSLAAKVLASRALETVTGLPIDPARLSEHD